MSDYEEVKSQVMQDGMEYRAILRRDDDAGEPYDDGQWPILKVHHDRSYGYKAEAFNDAANPYVGKFNALQEGGYLTEVFERYVRIFHGANHVHTYGPNNGTDYTYIAFDPAEWRERVPGLEVDLSQENPLAEIVAWIEGDTYGVIIEKRWNPDGEYDDDEDGGWDEVESVWGFYGRKYAKEQARADLDAAVASHRIVHRYTEHEKVAKHETEVNAILGFLEGLDSGDYRLAKVWPRSEFQGPHLQSVPESHHQRIVFEHFGIDYGKIEEERELMFKRLQEDAAKDTNT